MKKVSNNLEKYYPIFSYGSNHSTQLFDRCGGAVIGPVQGYINNHARIFAGYSSRWKGGIASIHPSKGDRVMGSVFYLNKEQLEILDSWEGGYHRAMKQVVLSDGSKIMSFVYIKDDPSFTYLPSVSYLKAIRRMLHETDPSKKPFDIKGVMENKRIRTVAAFNADGTMFLNEKLTFPRDLKLLCGPEDTEEQGGGQSNSSAEGFTIPKSMEPYAVSPIFSYGSNNIGRLRENYGRIVNDAVAAYLPQYMRVFGGHSPSWEGAVASVFPSKGARCYGAVVFLTDKQLVELDAYEGLGYPGWYTREVLSVVVSNKHGEHTIPCYCYIKEDVDFVEWPSVPYMKTIRTLLEDVGFKKESKDILITVMKNNKKYKEAHFVKNRVVPS
jgi:gamma-glutamylcyclotransferase